MSGENPEAEFLKCSGRFVNEGHPRRGDCVRSAGEGGRGDTEVPPGPLRSAPTSLSFLGRLLARAGVFRTQHCALSGPQRLSCQLPAEGAPPRGVRKDQAAEPGAAVAEGDRGAGQRLPPGPGKVSH